MTLYDLVTIGGVGGANLAQCGSGCPIDVWDEALCQREEDVRNHWLWQNVRKQDAGRNVAAGGL